MTSNEWKEIIALASSGHREYASFFDWPDKQVKELGVVQEFLKALPQHGLGWRNARSYQPDPPDCICIDELGNLVALEVVEFVSQEAIERNERNEDVLCRWSSDDIKGGIADILLRKDHKRFGGGPYADIAVVMHTDEPVMAIEDVQAALAGCNFGPFEKISKAFLTFSYTPRKGYQVLKLPVSVGEKG